MKKRFWNTLIEFYDYGAVKAAVIRSRESGNQPRDRYRKDPGLEAFSLWFEDEGEARDAVLEALTMGAEAVA